MSRPELALYSGEGEGKGRLYKHPFLTGEDGKPLSVPSVTTILKLEDKSALVQWAVNLTVDWAVKNWMTLASRSEEDAKKTAQYRWRDVRDERAFVGTGVHDTIESEHVGSWDFPELDEEQIEIMEEWRKFNTEWDVEPILSEFTVWCHEYQYAGTADGLWRLTNRRTGGSIVALLDIKTSRKTWPGHMMQLAALANAGTVLRKVDPAAKRNSKGVYPDGAWVEEPMPDFDQIAILHLRAPERDEFGEITEPAKHDLIEVIDTDLWWSEFLGYRHVLTAQKLREAREKARIEDAKPKWAGF